MICPMLTIRKPYIGDVECYKKQCAWWDDSDGEGKCCIITIAKNFNYIADICDGTKNLFIREV